MKKLFFSAIIIIGSSLFTLCDAQYTDIYNFNGTNGSQPVGSLTLSGGVLFGTTNIGGTGDSGTIFKIDTNGNGYKKLLDFNGPNGNGPVFGFLALSGNRLYGMVNQGGANHLGCVYSIDTNGSGYRDLLDFNYTNGGNPAGSVIVYGNKLYGMTQYGGAHDSGCVFSVDTLGNNYKDLLDFNGTNGQFPFGSLTVMGSELFGMVNFGVGRNQDGGIFSMDTDGSIFKDLLNFDGTNGKFPYGDLIVSGNKLYGMTSSGGADSDGNVFSIDSNGDGFQNLLSFNSINGLQPWADLTLSGKMLFGMTRSGGAYSDGNVFSVDTDGSGFADLLDFDGTNGYGPWGSSVTISGNVLYGMAQTGGTNNDGVIFSLKDTSIVTSVNKITANKETISVYPNPSTGQITIQTSVTGNQLTVKVYNVLGEQVYSKSNQPAASSNQPIVINLSSQPNGVYLYRVMAENGQMIGEGKVVIQK
jgi:uncharacterized repeat protein (TIGR03803 family)